MQRIADVKTPVQLYKHLCRRVRELPVPVQEYYKHYIRQVFHFTQTQLPLGNLVGYTYGPPHVTDDILLIC